MAWRINALKETYADADIREDLVVPRPWWDLSTAFPTPIPSTAPHGSGCPSSLHDPSLTSQQLPSGSLCFCRAQVLSSESMGVLSTKSLEVLSTESLGVLTTKSLDTDCVLPSGPVRTCSPLPGMLPLLSCLLPACCPTRPSSGLPPCQAGTCLSRPLCLLTPHTPLEGRMQSSLHHHRGSGDGWTQAATN